MELNFAAALNDPRIGGPGGIFRLANEARTPASYLLATLLPERRLPTYEASDGSMTIRTTMAGVVGMDSAYPEGGVVDLATFRERVIKIAIQNNLSEETLRQLQTLADQVVARGGSSTDLAVNTILNFVQKLLQQPQWDRREWLRGQALFTGEIDWQYNGITVQVDYGIPSANKFATRTGTAAYGGSASVFWSDMREARRLLGSSYEISIANRTTIEEIIYNDANSINVLGIEGGRYRIQRFRGSLERPSTDARETMTIVEYNAEGEVLDPSNPGQTIKVPFVPNGVIGHFGRADNSSEFIPGEGATQDPEDGLELGYTHLGPTTESGGRPGDWARVYTPEDMPMQVRGQSASNPLPVIRSAKKIVLASTALS